MRLPLVLSFACCSLAVHAYAQAPMMNKVSPDSGKVGSVLQVQGKYLDKAQVDEVYLSDHTFDMKVKVLNQDDKSIQFRIPPSVKPGRLQLVVKTVGKEPLILEQPVYITVEEPNDQKEIATASK